MTPRRSSCRTSSCRRGGASREGLASACRHSGGATVGSQRSHRPGGAPMHTYNGDKFFVVDGHVHFWDASPANWVSGQEQYAKGWIECFHAYMGLGPEETYPDRLIANGRWDPREGDAGMRQLEADAERYGLKGVKLYTAEWYQGSRGWSLKDPESQRFLDKCQELGIKNIHVHKGPTIWPLDKDSFDVRDVDFAATNNPELNFIVEHVGLPRIEDFCFMATQEPNVYAGLAVVIGGLMHARPRFFAKVMGELLFWVGEDKMLFASDYAIWEPRWQVEGFVDWTYPEDVEYSDYPQLDIAGKKKILGLNAAKLYGIDVPEELRLPDEAGTPAAREDAQLVSEQT